MAFTVREGSMGDQGAGKAKWIQGAKIHKGGLHKSLGIPQGEKIPVSKIKAAASKGGKVGKQARLALAFRGMKH